MFERLKKIEIKRKFVYLTNYGGSKPILKIPKNKIDLSISINLPQPEPITELGKGLK